MALNLTHRQFYTPCTVTVLHTEETLEAHVELDGDLNPEIGDRIIVGGAPVQVRFGETLVLRREAKVTRAAVWDKLWTRLKSFFLLTELYEVSFSTGRLR
ncbi:MAG: hypothetical protein AAGJ87_12615 [Pseudomonadota bacterium]